jgi:hypothetical protein
VPAEERIEGVVALSRWRAVLARSRNTRKRVDLLLADPQAAAIVPRIPIEELYYLVRGIGLEDASDVVRLASPEQVQGFLDLDLWERDRLSMPRVFAWFEALAELPPSTLARAIRALDTELIALVIGREAHVYDRGVGEAPEDDSRFIVYGTPDAAFAVEFRTATATAARTIERFIAGLYDADPDLARAILTDAKWGTTAELEEESFRWRTSRLADMGFPSYDEALGVYRRIDPAEMAAPIVSPPVAPGSTDAAALPAPFADAFGGDTLLERALAALDDPTALARVSAALVALLNRVLVADRADPADVDRVREVSARARDTLSLALDHLSAGDVATAAARLERLPLVDVFRLGVSLVEPLAARGRALDRAGVVDPNLEALLEPRPLFPCGLDAPPTGGERPFRTTADLAAVDAYLRDIERDPATH